MTTGADVLLGLRRAPLARAFATLLAALALVGCAGHSARTEEARTALDVGSPRKALAKLNEELEVDSAEKLPEDISGDNTLLLLDRAMILQSLASFGKNGWLKHSELSSRDLEAADKQIEVLDLSRGAVDDIGKYMFSDSTGPYKAPTYEKLMINTMNMLNYLVRGDLNGARIEARRLAVMQKYVSDHENIGASLTGPGSYLAGFIFEKSDRPQEALRYYDEALQHGQFESLKGAVVRLCRRSSYRSPRITGILKEAGVEPTTGAPSTPEPERKAEAPSEQKPAPTPPAPETSEAPPGGRDDGEAPAAPRDERTAAATADGSEPSPAEPLAGHDEERVAEVLVVINFGRVPAKISKRIPIGLALTWASGAMSPASRSKANYLAAQGLVTWINFPELGKARGQYGTPGFALNGDWQRLEGALAVDDEARREWDRAKGAVIASAITRMITRVAAGEATRRAAGGGLVGALLSLGTQAALTAADTPDTRSWSTLPARVAIGRVAIEPGTHWIDVEARGVRKRQKITVRPGDWAVVNLTVLN